MGGLRTDSGVTVFDDAADESITFGENVFGTATFSYNGYTSDLSHTEISSTVQYGARAGIGVASLGGTYKQNADTSSFELSGSLVGVAGKIKIEFSGGWPSITSGSLGFGGSYGGQITTPSGDFGAIISGQVGIQAGPGTLGSGLVLVS